MAAMSPATVDVLVLCFMVALTLWFGISLFGVFRLFRPDLNDVARTDLDGRITRFKSDVLNEECAAAGARGRKEVRKKDVRTGYRQRLARQGPRVLERVSLFGGVTISFAGAIFALPEIPHFPPQSADALKIWNGASALVAAIALVYDSSELLHGIVGRRRRSTNRARALAEAGARAPSTQAPPAVPADVESRLDRYGARLAGKVRREARRRCAGKDEVTPQDIGNAWRELVNDTPAAAPAPISRRSAILRGMTAFVAIIAVTGALYLAAPLVRAKLPTGQVWLFIATIATLFAFYLVVINGPRIITAAWNIIGAIADWLRERGKALGKRVGRIASNGVELVGGLFRPRRAGRAEGRRPTISASRSAAPPQDLSQVLDALRFGWYMAEVRGRNGHPPPPHPPGQSRALPLRTERTAAESRIAAQAVLATLAASLQVDLRADVTSYSGAVDQEAMRLAGARELGGPSAGLLWDSLEGLIYDFDAHVQDTLTARSETQATAYQLGRGLAEAYWALDPDAACDPVTPGCWAFLLGEHRCDELTRLAGLLSPYFSPYCIPAVAGTVRMWQSVASDADWRKAARGGHLHRQLRRWYDLLVLGQDPTTLIRPYALITTWQVSLRVLQALWIQVVMATVSLAVPIALIATIGHGSGDVFLQVLLGVAGAVGLAAATAQAILKNRAQDLLNRLRHDAYTDLVIAAVAEVPGKPRARRYARRSTPEMGA
jgi:hypothetical protein